MKKNRTARRTFVFCKCIAYNVVFFYWSKTCSFTSGHVIKQILVGAMQQQDRFYDGLCQVYFRFMYYSYSQTFLSSFVDFCFETDIHGQTQCSHSFITSMTDTL